MPADEKTGETPTEQKPPEIGGEKPFDFKIATVEELRAEYEKQQRTLTNKTEENTRIHKKLDGFEKAEDERKKAAMTETEKLKADLEAANKKLAEHNRTEQRRTIAAKVGLPLAFASRLQGETPEELEADAKSLLEALPKPPPEKKLPNISATNPGGVQKPDVVDPNSPEYIRERTESVHGGNSNFWDPRLMALKGGGAVVNPKEGENK